MSDLLNVDWLTFRAATAIAKTRTYVQLPTFTHACTWLGASEIITQFNFSASKNFVLRNRPTKPTGVNYCLCIRYRVGDAVYRWKLWQDAGEVLNVPLYNGEIIKKHFVLEIWNVKDGTTVSSASAINIITSVVSVPTNFRDLSSTALATGVEYTKASIAISITPKTLPNTSELAARWETDSGVTVNGSNEILSWTDSVGGFNLVPDPFYNKPTLVSSDAGVNNKPVTQHDVIQPLGVTGIVLPLIHAFIILRQRTWGSDRNIFSFDTGGFKQVYAMQKNGGATPAIEMLHSSGAIGDLAQVPVGVSATFRVIEIVQVFNTSVVVNTRSLDGTALETVNLLASPLLTGMDAFSFARPEAGYGSGGARLNVAAAIIYNTLQQSSDVTRVFEFINEKYGGAEQGFSFPATVGVGNAWYSND